MATGFTPPSPIEPDTSGSITAKETPPKLARFDAVAFDQNQNKEHVPVMWINMSTAATLESQDFDHTPVENTGFSPPSLGEPAETIPVDDNSPDSGPQFSTVQLWT